MHWGPLYRPKVLSTNTSTSVTQLPEAPPSRREGWDVCRHEFVHGYGNAIPPSQGQVVTQGSHNFDVRVQLAGPALQHHGGHRDGGHHSLQVHLMLPHLHSMPGHPVLLMPQLRGSSQGQHGLCTCCMRGVPVEGTDTAVCPTGCCSTLVLPWQGRTWVDSFGA